MHSDCWYSHVCPQVRDGCEVTCLKYLEMKHLMDESGIPKAKQIPSKLIPESDEDFKSFTKLQAIKDDIVNFVNSGKSLYICSEYVGNGKTSWALKLMLRYFDQIWAGNGFKTRGLFVHVPTLLLKIKDFQNPLSEEFKSNLMNCDLIVWDDIATSTISNYDYSNLLMYIDSRMMMGKANIYTSNIVSVEDLQEKLSAKLADRIWTLSQVITLYGGNHREDERR